MVTYILKYLLINLLFTVCCSENLTINLKILANFCNWPGRLECFVCASVHVSEHVCFFLLFFLSGRLCRVECVGSSSSRVLIGMCGGNVGGDSQQVG